jgi:hypothetical protein
VKARSQLDAQRVVTFELGPDLAEDMKFTKHRVKQDYQFGSILFNPDELKQPNSPLKVEEHRLSVTKLQAYGELTTKLRAEVRARAESLRGNDVEAHDGSDEEAKDHQSVMQRAFLKKKDRPREECAPSGFESKYVMTRRKPLRRNQLTAKQVEDIVLTVKSGRLSQSEVGIKHNVSHTLVCRLLKAFK